MRRDERERAISPARPRAALEPGLKPKCRLGRDLHESADQRTGCAVSPLSTARPQAAVEPGSKPEVDWAAGLCSPRPVAYRDTGPTAEAGEWPGMAGPGRGPWVLAPESPGASAP